MAKKEIPEEIIKSLEIKFPKAEPIEVTLLIEKHQVKIPIPSAIRHELDLKKGSKCNIIYDKKKREIICKLK